MINLKNKYRLFILLFCFIYGFMEYGLISQVGTTGERVLFNHFSRYHIGMLFLFSLIAYTYDLRILPSMFLIEDMFYHLAGLMWPVPGSWIDYPLPGFYILWIYIPGGYVFILIINLLIYNYNQLKSLFFFIFKRKNK